MGKKSKNQEGGKKGAPAAGGPAPGVGADGKNQYGYDAAQYNTALDELMTRIGKLPEGDCYNRDWVASFLRARKLNIDKAEAMCRASLEWRQKNGADTILAGPPPDERILKYMPHGFTGRSKKGGPVYYERTGRARLWKLMGDLTPEQALHWKVYYQELGGKLSREGKDSPLGVVVMDMDGLAMKNATKAVMEFYQMQGGVDEANYPETLEKVLVVNTNWVFTTLWKVAKYFFAEEIREKISILGGSYEAELKELIDPSQYPPYLKGSTHKGTEEWMGDCSHIEDLPKLP